jgi:Protein of unknown function (DUF4038)/Putative collagen-binding domain of a collagenase/Abnormal spindle-like microcephaly-assoc'd, ASPM-SPD-2-Hydin
VQRLSRWIIALVFCLVALVLARPVLLRKPLASLHKKPTGAPAASLTPSWTDFGVQAIGTNSRQRVITLTNTGSAQLQISRLALLGTDQNDFHLNPHCSLSLAPGENCSLMATFSPSRTGALQSVVAVSDSANGSSQTLTLRGFGTNLTSSEAALDFGDQKVGVPSGAKAIVFTNNGASALQVARLTVVGADAQDFSEISTCNETLPPGAQCTVSLTFQPSAKGQRYAALQINDAAGAPLQHLPFVGVGTGTGQLMALSPDKTHLMNTLTNKPVFITGEAAWSLIAQPADGDVETYLSDRARRGFNAIIVNLIEHQYADHAPADYAGDAPFTGAIFSTPNEAYFRHADQVISRAAAHGITVFLFPAYLGYGSHQCNVNKEGWGTDMAKASEAVLRDWGAYVGNRYKSFPNIVYVIGCDADPRTCSPSLVGKLNAVAVGIKSADPGHLMTADNAGNQSSLDVWSGYPWLDISYMYGASDVAKLNSEYSRRDFLPFFQGEDTYENEQGTTPLTLRTRQYWSALSGAYLGSFFGNNPIWCFNETNPASAVPCPSQPTWQSQLSSPGSVGQSWFGKLFRSRAHWLLIPDLKHEVVTAGYGSGTALTTTASTRNSQTILSYIPNGSATTLTVDMSKISSAGKSAKCWWFNPRDGSTKLIGVFANSSSRPFTPPDSNDWVLVIDDAHAGLPAPASRDL